MKQTFATLLHSHINACMSLDRVMEGIEKPSYASQGDLAFPCFSLAKVKKKSPHHIALQLAGKIESPLFEKVVANGAYVNVFLNKRVVSERVMKTILKQEETYGSHSFGKRNTVTIDFSSPNIAKPFSMGHLCSTVIGNSLAHIAEKCGYRVIRINHLGDWGTQFGKLIVAYHRWGDESEVRADPIPQLMKLYVKFHEEANEDSSLEEEARQWFKKLEAGNQEAHRLWTWFKEESLQEFTKIYDLLGIHFDCHHGEAFYNDKMNETIDQLAKKGLITQSEGAEVVDLASFNLPPCLIRKSDGATLYATRDLTAAIYRQQKYKFTKALYVVGEEQRLHFQQVFAVLKQMGYEWAANMEHIPFGLILKNGKKMSTRKGKVVLLEDVIDEAFQLAKKMIEEKNPTLRNKLEIAKQVGVGAIIFQDLKNERQNNIEFSFKNMFTFTGTTGPYVQYTYARACSVINKANVDSFKPAGLNDTYSWDVIKILLEFPPMIKSACIDNDPSKIAKYVLKLAQAFNKYYTHVQILADDDEQPDRLSLVKSVTIVLKEGLQLLGIQAPKEM